MVFRSRSPGIAYAPEILGKKQCKDSKENTRYFMPQSADRAGKWLPESLPKATAAPGEASGNVACRFARTYLSAWLGGLPLLDVRLLLRRHLGCFRASSTVLRPVTQNFCGDAGADPQLAA